MSSFEKLLGDHLARDETLSPLIAKAERLRLLEEKLREIAPAELARTAYVANLRQDTVIVRVSSSAAAAKLKLVLPRLLAGFQSLVSDVKAVKVDVRFPASAFVDTKRRRKYPLPPPAQALEQLAAELPDSRLRDAVQSLAKKGRR